MHIKNIYYTAHSMHLSLLSLGVGIVEFWVLEGGQNIFLISGGGVVPWGGGGGRDPETEHVVHVSHRRINTTY